MTHPQLEAATAAYRAGRFDESSERCVAALALLPGDEAWMTLLAISEHAAGHLEAAAEAFRGLVAIRPAIPEHWSNLGYMQRLLGRYSESEESFRKALELAPTSYEALVNYGLLLLDMGRFGAARHRLLDAVDSHPGSIDARIYAATACFECGDTARAAQLIPPPWTWDSLQGDLRHDLGMLLIHAGRISEAEQMLDPDALQSAEPAAIARLAMLHERTNRIDSARALLERVRSQAPHGDPDLEADLLTAEAALAMRAKDFARARERTLAMLSLELPAPARANAYFTLASVADKEGDVELAMKMLSEAHSIQLRLGTEIAPEIADSDEDPLRIAAKYMGPEQAEFDADRAAPSARQSPVFIVGFPRSGTTMLEQMLDAHPRFTSMDEQPILQSCIERMKSLGFEYPYELGRLDPPGLSLLREVYWSEVAKVAPPSDGKRLVDKNPLNLLRLPMIHRLFPNAKIILALRHPCDVILSCYMQNFRSPAFMLLCSSLPRLGRSYSNSMQSWIHHQELLGPDVLTLRYEDTVSDFPAQVDRIADFLDIEERRHLEDFSAHAARKGYISTPSYSQVIEPVNTKAVGRWHAYKQWFEPVLPILQPVADHWGYTLEAD
ncbi:MAG: sulfotransferase [Luteimonas sp.]